MEFFGIGLPELLVIMVLTLIVVGPQRLPEMAAQIARFMREFRRYTAEISRDVSDALQDIEREYGETKEEWKEVGEAIRREGEAIDAEVSGAAREAREAVHETPEPTAPKPAEDKVVSMEKATGRRAERRERTPPSTEDSPPGRAGS